MSDVLFGLKEIGNLLGVSDRKTIKKKIAIMGLPVYKDSDGKYWAMPDGIKNAITKLTLGHGRKLTHRG